jgi:hypothetical protein
LLPIVQPSTNIRSSRRPKPATGRAATEQKPGKPGGEPGKEAPSSWARSEAGFKWNMDVA